MRFNQQSELVEREVERHRRREMGSLMNGMERIKEERAGGRKQERFNQKGRLGK